MQTALFQAGNRILCTTTYDLRCTTSVYTRPMTYEWYDVGLRHIRRNPTGRYLLLINIISYRSTVTFSFSSAVTRNRSPSEAVHAGRKQILRACAEAYFRPSAHTYMRLVLRGARGAATGVLLIKVAKTKTYFHVYSVGSFVLLVRAGEGTRPVQGAPPTAPQCVKNVSCAACMACRLQWDTLVVRTRPELRQSGSCSM